MASVGNNPRSHRDSVQVPYDLLQWIDTPEAEVVIRKVKSSSNAREIKLIKERPGKASLEVQDDSIDSVVAACALLENQLNFQVEFQSKKSYFEKLDNDLKATRNEFNEGLRVAFSVPESLLGLVIGKGGANVNKVKEATGVDKVVVDNKTRTVRIRGADPEAVAKAREMLEFQEIVLPINPADIRGVLGERGRKISEIWRKSNCVNINAETFGDDNHAIRIVGTKNAVDLARKLIDQQVACEEEMRKLVQSELSLKRELKKIDADFREFGSNPPVAPSGGRFPKKYSSSHEGNENGSNTRKHASAVPTNKGMEAEPKHEQKQEKKDHTSSSESSREDGATEAVTAKSKKNQKSKKSAKTNAKSGANSTNSVVSSQPSSDGAGEAPSTTSQAPKAGSQALKGKAKNQKNQKGKKQGAPLAASADKELAVDKSISGSKPAQPVETKVNRAKLKSKQPKQKQATKDVGSVPSPSQDLSALPVKQELQEDQNNQTGIKTAPKNPVEPRKNGKPGSKPNTKQASKSSKKMQESKQHQEQERKPDQDSRQRRMSTTTEKSQKQTGKKEAKSKTTSQQKQEEPLKQNSVKSRAKDSAQVKQQSGQKAPAKQQRGSAEIRQDNVSAVESKGAVSSVQATSKARKAKTSKNSSAKQPVNQSQAPVVPSKSSPQAKTTSVAADSENLKPNRQATTARPQQGKRTPKANPPATDASVAPISE